MGEWASEILLTAVCRQEPIQSGDMNDWACTSCGKGRANVETVLIDPRFGFAYCMTCKNTRTFQRRASPQVEVAHARRTDPITSHLAAASVQGIRASQRMILGALVRHGPGTDEDIYRWLKDEGHNISLSGARTRRSELVRLGIVEDSGEKTALPSRRLAVIWRLKPGGSSTPT